MSTTIIAGNATNNGASISSDTAGSLQIQTGSTPTTAIAVDSSQKVGIGTTSPSNLLTVYSAATRPLSVQSATDTPVVFSSTGANAYMQLTGSGDVYLGSVAGAFTTTTNGAERLRVDTSGNLLIATTSVIGAYGQKLSIFFSDASKDGITLKHANATGGAAPGYINFFNSSGTQVGYIACNGTITIYSTSSDYRLKENIAPMQNALSVVQQLKPVTYNWKSDGSNGQGFIAHELAEVVPECVSGEKDAVNEDGSIKAQGIDTSFLVATLTAAIQEQQAMIEELKTKVLALEAK